MKIGDNVELVKAVPYDDGILQRGTKGIVSNILRIKDEEYVVFVIEEPLQAFVLQSSSVK